MKSRSYKDLGRPSLLTNRRSHGICEARHPSGRISRDSLAKRLGGQCRTSTGARLEGVAMIVPHPIPWTAGETLGDHLRSRGVSRREFLQFCGGLAAVFGLDRLAVPRIARALESIKRPSRRLDPAPGMHRLRRERPSHGGADDRQPGARSRLARLLAHAHGRGRQRRRASAAGRDAGQRRQVPPGRDRLGSARRRTASTPRSAAAPRRRSWRRRRRAPPR